MPFIMHSLRCCEGLKRPGISIDAEKNNSPSSEAREINQSVAPVTVLVIPTNEELEVAIQTVDTILAVK